MQRLSETQAAFASAVSDPDAAIPHAVTSHAAPKPRKRFNVYRNNIHASLTGVLEGRFPAVARLVGEEFFAATARVYIGRHPPRSPILMEYGETFPDFLETFEPVADVPYLPDVARIEWAWSKAYYAADAEPVSPVTLQTIAPDAIGSSTIRLHPSLSVVRSAYPAVTIWAANVAEEDPEPIDAGMGGEDAMVLRPRSKVEVRTLPEGGASFVQALLEGVTLQEAAERTQGRYQAFDLTHNIAGLFQSEAVVAIERRQRET